MKKFLTVLLALSVVFTYSFGTVSSAFADTANPVTDVNDANMIKQAAEYAKSGLPASVQKAYETVLAKGTNNTYITKAAWDAAANDIVDAMEEAIDTSRDAYLAGTATLPNGWDAYDYAYAAGVLYTGYSYTELAVKFSNDDDASAIMAAKKQFKIDLADALAIYDKIDLSRLYSTTTPTTGKTYYQQAVEAIDASKAVFNDYFLAEDGSVINLENSVQKITDNGKGLTNAIYNGVTLDGKTNTKVLTKKYDGTDVVEYYYLDGIKTIDSEKGDDAENAATTAAIKAQVAKNVAVFLKSNTSASDKTFAENYSKLYNYLAEVLPTVDKLSADVIAHQTMMAGVKTSHGASIATALEDVADLEAYAAKYAAEKDATGALVRDAEEVKKLVEKAKTYELSKVVNISDASIKTYTIETAKRDIAAMTTSGDAAKLAFDKEAKKAALDTALETALEDYYDLEATKVKEAYDVAKAKVDAAKDQKEFTEIDTALTKEINKIKTTGQVEALFNSGKMNTELTKQVTALKAYVTYKNTPVAGKEYEEAYVKLADSKAAKLLRDYYIEKGARTEAEMKALTNAVEDIAATLPTTGTLATAKKAADDAVKALPSASKTTSADKSAYQNAFDLAKKYNEMAEIATGTAGNVAIPTAQVDAIKNAIQSDFLLAYAKADKTDKDALKAIAADVKAANDEVGADKLFTSKFTDPTTDALAKIRAAQKAAVIAAINAIPINVTEDDKATVEAARKLYDAYVAEYTDYDNADNGYAAKDFANVYHTLALAEAALGLNEDPVKDVESLKIIASSKAVKGKITVKWRVKGDASNIDGYQVYKSTKAQSGYKFMGKTKKLYMDNKKNLKKGKRYFYKVRAYKVVDGKKYYSDWSNKANRYAK